MKSPVEAHGWNLATRTPAERLAVDADRIACRLRHTTRLMGKLERQRAVGQELDRMVPELRELVLQALRARAKS